MFCPNCGSEQVGQYCRSCGTDLNAIRTAFEKPDAIQASAISARDEIGRAVADRIRELKSAKDLAKVVEEVLPEISKFLEPPETPEEKRLGRIRAGTIIAAIGLGVMLAFGSLGILSKENEQLFLAGLGIITLLIGLGIIFNGWLFTIPERRRDQRSGPFVQTTTESSPILTPNAATQNQLFTSSVTEHTTHQLANSQLRAGEAELDQRK